MQCKQECLWTATRCQVQVLYYSAVKYTVILRSYVVVNFGTGYVSRDDVSRGTCSYKRNSKMGRVVPNCFNQDLKIYIKRIRNMQANDTLRRRDFLRNCGPFIWITFVIQQ